jgi:hypothetical protein
MFVPRFLPFHLIPLAPENENDVASRQALKVAGRPESPWRELLRYWLGFFDRWLLAPWSKKLCARSASSAPFFVP